MGLDFSKAFDIVSHSILLDKVFSTQPDKSLLCWMSDWLMGQAQRVTVKGVTSGWQTVTSSIPQGSVLGPVLFNVFINDLHTRIQCTLGQFADSSKLGEVVDSFRDREDLQRDLNSLESWAIISTVKLSKRNCRSLHLGEGNPGYTYRLGEERLEGSPMKTAGDLG